MEGWTEINIDSEENCVIRVLDSLRNILDLAEEVQFMFPQWSLGIGTSLPADVDGTSALKMVCHIPPVAGMNVVEQVCRQKASENGVNLPNNFLEIIERDYGTEYQFTDLFDRPVCLLLTGEQDVYERYTAHHRNERMLVEEHSNFLQEVIEQIQTGVSCEKAWTRVLNLPGNSSKTMRQETRVIKDVASRTV